MASMSLIRKVRAAAFAVLLLPLAACYEEPVEERLYLCFLPQGEVVLTVTGEIHTTGSGGDNAALEDRVKTARYDFGSGLQSWDARFAALEPAAERLVIEREAGQVRRVARAGVAVEPEELRRFFQLTDVDLSFSIVDHRALLEIQPRASTRATTAERRLVAAELATWAAQLVTYLTRGGELYRYLDTRPERAEPCLARLFGARQEEKVELTEEEDALVKALSEAIDQAARILDVSPGEAYTLEEASRKVYDPFPARLSLTLPSRPEEVEGFAVGQDGHLTVPGLSLWEALAALTGRWLSPDPLRALVEHLRRPASRADFPLGDFLLQQRKWQSPPTAEQLALALQEHLAPAARYRVAWQLAEPPEEPSAFSWSSIPCPQP